METTEVKILSHDEIGMVFQKIRELNDSIKRKESEIHAKIIQELDPQIFNPIPLGFILKNERFEKYHAEARKELLHISLELKNITENIFK